MLLLSVYSQDLKLLKLANLEDICDSSFLVINGNWPKQKVQLLERFEEEKSAGKYTFLERLLGVTRVLSQMVESMLKGAINREIYDHRYTKLNPRYTSIHSLNNAKGYINAAWSVIFHKIFSDDISGACTNPSNRSAKMLLDDVLLYNTVSSISQREQTVKLNEEEGFEVFREYYPAKEEDSIVLECIWQRDTYVLLVERKHKYKYEANSQEKDVMADVSI
ncbi:hypothetical protein OROGR_012382 [Orobanche gracilis]